MRGWQIMNVLVVYYSRTGMTRKAGEAIADALREAGCQSVEIEEIVEPKSRKGAVGFLGAGRDATLKRPAVIEPIKADVSSFDLVVIGTPVWAFTCATPVRTFCEKHGTEAHQVAFYCTMGGSGDRQTFQAVESLCGRPPVATLALIDRHVKANRDEDFLAKVREFAKAIVSA